MSLLYHMTSIGLSYTLLTKLSLCLFSEGRGFWWMLLTKHLNEQIVTIILEKVVNKVRNVWC